MSDLTTRCADRLSGPAWDGVRPLFEDVSQTLLNVSTNAKGELTTIYVKYSAPETQDQPYAVVWLRKSSELVVGLALQEPESEPELTPAPPRHTYARLTGYFRLQPGDTIPPRLAEWARIAYESQISQ